MDHLSVRRIIVSGSSTCSNPAGLERLLAAQFFSDTDTLIVHNEKRGVSQIAKNKWLEWGGTVNTFEPNADNTPLDVQDVQFIGTGADALIVCTDGEPNERHRRMLQFARQSRIPTIDYRMVTRRPTRRPGTSGGPRRIIVIGSATIAQPAHLQKLLAEQLLSQDDTLVVTDEQRGVPQLAKALWLGWHASVEVIRSVTNDLPTDVQDARMIASGADLLVNYVHGVPTARMRRAVELARQVPMETIEFRGGSS